MVLIRRLLAASTAAFAVAACGSSGTADSPASTGLVATTSIWADITSNVACGDEVVALIPAGVDPHTFEPSLRDRELLAGAEIVVANGGGLESAVVDLLDTVATEGVNVVEIAPHVDVIVDGDHDEDDDESGESDGAGDDGHGHDAEFDPHIWQDPRRIAGALDVIASAVMATGRDEDAIRSCTDTYRADLLALDAEIDDLLGALPADQRVMVTSHDSLAYFADRYGLTVVGTVVPSTSTLAETSAADLAALGETIESHRVRTIFTEELESAGDATALAERLGVRVVPLVTDALTDDAVTYVELLRANAAAIAEGLAP